MHWIRLWVDHIVNGTTFAELNAEQRGVWFTLLVMAGYSPVPGTICIAEGIPYTDEQIAGITKLAPEVLLGSISHLCSDEVSKLVRNQDGTLSIKKWGSYQTEYQRQKPFRRGLQGKVTRKGYDPELQAQSVSVSVSVSGSSNSSSKGENTEFEDAWAIYPKRTGGNPKRDAETAWNARINAGASSDEMLVGVAKYGKYCESSGIVGTSYVMQAKRFFGPSEPFKDDWSEPEKTRTQKNGTHQKPDNSAPGRVRAANGINRE